MFRLLTVEDVVRVPPHYFGLELGAAILQLLREKYERKVDVEDGVVLRIANVRNISGGTVVFGDGAAYYNVTFDALVFVPELHEIIDGEIIDVVDFGAFVNLGPLDALIHLSQITDELISFDRKAAALITKSKRTLKKGDLLRAKIVTVSMRPAIPETKVALTMRGEGLGKHEWLAEAEAEKEKEKEKAKEIKRERKKKEKEGKERKEGEGKEGTK